MNTPALATALLAAVLPAACTKVPSLPDARPAASTAPAADATPAMSAVAPTHAAPTAAQAKASTTPATVDPTLPKVLVHKSPTCGCCSAWAEHMRRNGFTVQVHETEALEPIRKRLGVPAGKGSCHTAEVGGLVVEGHVPAADVKRLLADRGDARGLTVPGMPMGSPGMEVPDGRVQPYAVERIHADGRTSVYARHGTP